MIRYRPMKTITRTMTNTKTNLKKKKKANTIRADEEHLPLWSCPIL